MTPSGRGRLVFRVAFVVLLADGAAAIWLGQVSGRGVLVGFGVSLVAGAVGLTAVYRRWQRAVAEVAAAGRAVRQEVEALRRAVAAARSGERGPA